MTEEEKVELLARIDRLEILCQNLDNRVDKLEKGEFGTGVYLDGCSENDIAFITNKPVEKVGE